MGAPLKSGASLSVGGLSGAPLSVGGPLSVGRFSMGCRSVWAALRAHSVYSVMSSAAEGWQPPPGALTGQEPYKV